MKKTNSLPLLSRRTVLRGAGVIIALPMLEAMMPTRMRAAEAATWPKRFQVFYTPNGMVMEDFVPKQAGAGYEITPILKPLEHFRDRCTVITGLEHFQATALGDGSGDHARSCGNYLTGAHPKKSEGYDVQCGVSMDQVVAETIGANTRLASLELGIDPQDLLGSCDDGYSCTYTNTISWRNATTPMPVSNNPRMVFERLFGDGENLDQASQLAQLRRRSSLIDFVREEHARMSHSLGVNDRRKMGEYLASIRDIEKRIQIAETNVGKMELPEFERPAGVPESFEDHVRLMIDLQVLALQADLCRVTTFMIGRELSARSYPQIGVPDAHHAMSHHGDDPEKLAKLSKINTYHMEMLAYQLRRLQDTEDGDGSLLDTTLILAGPSLGNSDNHDHLDIPAIIAGGLTEGGRHIPVRDTPFSNLMVTMMNRLGVNVASFGDSNGSFNELDA